MAGEQLSLEAGLDPLRNKPCRHWPRCWQVVVRQVGRTEGRPRDLIGEPTTYTEAFAELQRWLRTGYRGYVDEAHTHPCPEVP